MTRQRLHAFAQYTQSERGAEGGQEMIPVNKGWAIS